MMTIKTHALAAQAFADEVQASIAQLDMERASRMTEHLDTCLHGLKGLQDTLVMFPKSLSVL